MICHILIDLPRSVADERGPVNVKKPFTEISQISPGVGKTTESRPAVIHPAEFESFLEGGGGQEYSLTSAPFSNKAWISLLYFAQINPDLHIQKKAEGPFQPLSTVTRAHS